MVLSYCLINLFFTQITGKEEQFTKFSFFPCKVVTCLSFSPQMNETFFGTQRQANPRTHVGYVPRGLNNVLRLARLITMLFSYWFVVLYCKGFPSGYSQTEMAGTDGGNTAFGKIFVRSTTKNFRNQIGERS